MQVSRAILLTYLQIISFATVIFCSEPWNNLAARGSNGLDKALGILIRGTLAPDRLLSARSYNYPSLAKDPSFQEPIRREIESQRFVRRYLSAQEVQETIDSAEATIKQGRNNLERYKDFFKDPREVPRYLRRQLPQLRASIERKSEEGTRRENERLRNILLQRARREIVELNHEDRRAEARRLQEIIKELDQVATEDTRMMAKVLAETRPKTEAEETTTTSKSGKSSGGRRGRSRGKGSQGRGGRGGG